MSALASAGRPPSFMKRHLLSHPIFFDEKWRTIAAIVSAVNSRAFLGWLYGQFCPGALATFTSEVGTDLGGQVLGEDICGPNIMFGKKKHAHIRDRVLLGWVGSTIAAGLLLAMGGIRFCALIWGGWIALCIAALILGVLWKGGGRNGN
jgi:hypothetical protein